MKKQMMHRAVLRSVLITLLLPLCLTWPAVSQQKSSAGEHKAAVQASQASTPTASAANTDSGTPSSPPPVFGIGTAGFIPVWINKHMIGNSLLSETGNGLNVAGSMGATSFSGDGSALSNVNATALGGLGSGAFAQQRASNVFTGDQTINGNLTLTGSIDDTFTLQGNLSDAQQEEGANVIGGFGGDATYPGNGVAPGVIGATIAGGGGAVASTSVPSPRRQGRNAAKVHPTTFTIIQAPNFAGHNWATIGGGAQNSATGTFSTVAGGYKNTASGDESTVSGGNQNTASGTYSTVSGGAQNTASDVSATVAGGSGNSALVEGATVGGGALNSANGFMSTVPGGYFNAANGFSSFAAGWGAAANNRGSFVWSDGEAPIGGGLLEDTGPEQFVAAADGGFFFYTSLSNGIPNAGAVLPSGSGSWSSISDRNAKDNFAIIDGASLLAKIAALPISTWNYKTQATSIRHIGPMAQDFRAAFGLGEDDKHISNIDSEGVALAAVQALYKLNQEKDNKIAQLSQALEQLKADVEKLGDSASSKH